MAAEDDMAQTDEASAEAAATPENEASEGRAEVVAGADAETGPPIAAKPIVAKKATRKKAKKKAAKKLTRRARAAALNLMFQAFVEIVNQYGGDLTPEDFGQKRVSKKATRKKATRKKTKKKAARKKTKKKAARKKIKKVTTVSYY